MAIIRLILSKYNAPVIVGTLLCLLFLPVHIGLNSDFEFTIYDSETNKKEYLFFPLSVLVFLILLISSLNKSIVLLTFLGVFGFIWCALIYYSMGLNIRLITSVMMCIYFIAFSHVIKNNGKFIVVCSTVSVVRN